MAEMSIEYINPFLVAAGSVLQTACNIQLKAGKPYVRTNSFDENSVVICLGITGQLGGQVIIAFNKTVALELASKMCMMELTTLDELSISALSELGNMVLGNAATVLSTKNVIIDITPPVLIQGNFQMQSAYSKNICIPMTYDDIKLIELDISFTEVAQ